MPKEYVAVIFIGLCTLGLWQPAIRTLADATVLRRRALLWLALTSLAFLIPNYWIFIALTAPILLWAAKRDSNPIALYVFLINVFPPVAVSIPIIGAHGLFNLDSYRLLSLTILLPLAWRIFRSNERHATEGQRTLDFLLIAFLSIRILLFIPPDPRLFGPYHDSFTNLLRRVFLQFIDVYVLYFTVSRFCRSRERIRETVIYACIGLAIVAGVASFEYLRHWFLYAPLLVKWGDVPLWHLYGFTRDNHIRALATGGHPISLGYELAIGIGFWLYVKRYFPNVIIRLVLNVIFIGGLISAYSRGPWLGAIAIFICYEIIRRPRFVKAWRAFAIVTLVATVLFVSPLGNRIVAVIPILGGRVDTGSIGYRDRLATQSWDLIKSHLLFGDQHPYAALADLRQGEHIIDFVDTYAEIGVFYGLMGLGPFVAFMLLSGYRTIRLVRRNSQSGIDDDWVRLGAAIAACLVGTAIMMAGCSFIFDFPIYFFTLCGLASAYVTRDPINNAPLANLTMSSYRSRSPRQIPPSRQLQVDPHYCERRSSGSR